MTSLRGAEATPAAEGVLPAARLAAMQLVDRLAKAAMQVVPGGVVFPDGFGDPDHLELLDAPAEPGDPIPDLAVRWAPGVDAGDVRLSLGRFTSPWADLLPESAATGLVEFAEPPDGARRVVVLLPAWGHEDFEGRRRLARLLAGRGIGAVSLMNALYGPRRVHPDGLPIRTVGEFVLQAHVTVREARALLAGLRETHEVGVAGFSMGAGYTVATSVALPWPAAITPCAAAPSPARTFTREILGSRLADCFDEAARRRLFGLLDTPSALRSEPLPHHAAAVLVTAEEDGFVNSEEAHVLHAHWPGSELRVLPGGHATMWYLRKPALADAIADTFDRTWGTPTS